MLGFFSHNSFENIFLNTLIHCIQYFACIIIFTCADSFKIQGLILQTQSHFISLSVLPVKEVHNSLKFFILLVSFVLQEKAECLKLFLLKNAESCTAVGRPALCINRSFKCEAFCNQDPVWGFLVLGAVLMYCKHLRAAPGVRLRQ